MSIGKPKGPGALRRALFQDVPHILDSLWRGAEFKLNRIGSVDLSLPHELDVRPAWMSAAFVLYVLVCVFAVFGPTLDAMCSVDSADFAKTFRDVTGWILAIVAFVLFVVTLNQTTSRLARKGQILGLRTQRKEKSPAERPKLATPAADADEDDDEKARSIAGKVSNKLYTNLLRFFATIPCLKLGEQFALITAFVVLLLGAALLVSPLAASSYALITLEVDVQSCVQTANKHLVVSQLVGLSVLIGGGAAIWQLWGKKSALKVFAVSFALLVLVIGLLWWTSTATSEAEGGFYPHVYPILIGVLLAIALLARPFAWFMFRNLSSDSADMIQAALKSTDLLHSPRDAPDVSGVRLWSALVNGVANHLLQFLLLPAFMVFIAPATFEYWLAFGFAGVSIVLLVYGSLSNRWGQMLMYVDRWFLVGTPLVISILVIVIALARLMGVQYVATVIDATPIGVLFILVIMLYAAVWFLEYWINRWVGEQLLAVIGDRKEALHGYVPCAFAPDKAPPRVKNDGRYLALHGTGRFCALGWYEGSKPVGGEAKKGLAYTTYGYAEVFSTLGTKLPDGEEMAHEVRRRLALYFNVLNFTLILAMGGLIAWHLSWSRPLTVMPMVDVQTEKPVPLSEVTRATPAQQPDDPLADRLIAQAAASRPSIVVAASGGGTRAAVYTAVALEGIAQIDRAKDIVLLSGVSGGGVSAAVFASRYAALTTSVPGKSSPGTPDPWAGYVYDVSQPFIQDVLEGIGELRIVGPTSLGALLQESLQRRAFATGPQSVAALKTPTLILNTAISGHPYDDSELLKGRVSSPRADANCVRKARPYSNLAGGRLIFTNLANTRGFPQRTADAPDLWLPYRIINYGNVRLSAAAALTANFPPVFSNARVRIAPDEDAARAGACPQSYFVTDGGATENLGLVSALFALRGTLHDLPDGTKISDIHILALEASAISYDYSDDRGLGAATGGSKERINAGLTQRLLADVRVETERLGVKLVVHWLPLPVAFRSRGGFGTHWMFASTIRVANPHLPDQPDNSILPWVPTRGEVALDRQEVMTTLYALFDPDRLICDRSGHDEGDWTAGVKHVARWICGHDDDGRPDALKPDFQVEAWKGVVVALRPPRN